MIAAESGLDTETVKLNKRNKCHLNLPINDDATSNSEKNERIEYEQLIKSKVTDLDNSMHEKNGLTELQQFYNGKNVLITGATGFVGKILVQKLLRSCPGIENIYLLVRTKRGKGIHTRIDELFDDPIFGRLKAEVPNFRQKIVLVQGDCAAIGLGLSWSDRKVLMEKVNIIFHTAATVKFDEKIKVALLTNVQGPLQMLNLARDMKDLNVLIHISTAFSNSYLERIEEHFYPCDVDYEKLLNVLDKMTDKEIDEVLPTILGPWPNTYTFTKALAEEHIRLNSGKVPVGIFRPGIVTSTANEPLKSWIDNVYGPTGVAVGMATGTLRTLHCSMTSTADIVPVDYVVNCIIAAASNVHNTYRLGQPDEPPIFNYVSSVENRLTWERFLDSNLDKLHAFPFSDAVWYISLHLTSSRLLYNFYKVFLHILPAILADGLLLCLGQRPKMLQLYRKIHKFSSVIKYFCTREIQFCNAKVRELWLVTSNEDRKLFPFSMSELNWDEYFQEYVLGLRRYLFREDDATIPRAKVKWQRLYYLHQIVKSVYYCLVFYILWSIANRILL